MVNKFLKALSLAVIAAAVLVFFSPIVPLGAKALAAVAAIIAQSLFASGFHLGKSLGAQFGGQYLDMASGNAALKEYYDDQKVENLAYDDNPLLAMIEKDTDATGKVIPIPIIYETSMGASATFSNAQGNQSPMLLAEFFLTLRPDYSIATLAQQLMLASGNKAGSFLDFAQQYVDIALQSSSLRAALGMYGSGTGSRSQIATGGITAGVITLSNAADVAKFGINMVLQANATDGGTPRATLGYVIARNVVAGTITVSATTWGGAAGSPVGWTGGDYLLVQGDNNATISGLQAWLPATAPTGSDNFYGVNRSGDSRLYGLYYNGSAQPIEEALVDAAMLNRREKGRPRHCFTNFGSLSALIKALGARREFVDWTSEDGVVGFRGVKIQGPAGPIEVFADRNCPAATAFLLQLNTWKLYSLNPVPHIFKYGDGLEMLRLSNQDASEVRCGYYANMGTRAPGWNSQVALQS